MTIPYQMQGLIRIGEWVFQASRYEVRTGLGGHVEDLRIIPTNKNIERLADEAALCNGNRLAWLESLTDAERAFVRAMALDPLDRSTMLVFSDWLEERGRQEEAKRFRELATAKGK